MTRSGKTGRTTGDEGDLTRWDETIFDRCLKAGFNPFGSGPTPVFPREADRGQAFLGRDTLRNDSCDREDGQ